MAPSDDVRNPARSDENFVAPRMSGQHVLLVDDTWATGGHGESAAAALKRAGAARVTLLVLARWLNMGRGRTDEFVKDELTADFDPDLCPFDRC
jgi:adenine/guanine phosphoribosyltransferase-like PRPP-binding protein